VKALRALYRAVFPNALRSWLRERHFAWRIARERLLCGARYPYRTYNDRYRIIFVHIPKNAGTSILSLLAGGRNLPQEHTVYREFQKADPARYARYLSFAVVRNPWDRLLSAYAYLKAGGNGGTDAAFCAAFNTEVRDFRQFVCEWLDCDRIHTVRVLNPQYPYVCDQDGVLQVARIIRFERLEQELPGLLTEKGITGTLPRINRSERGDYVSYYDDASAARVAALYRNDVERFGYRFGGEA